MRNKALKIWLRKHGLLCRRYEYKVPTKPKVGKTIYPNGVKEFGYNGNEWYGIKQEKK